ncbi:MAG TPA: response regulator transcription factor [Gemmatirosa sp.]|nr:response regulator transcription factor [Gemmatirosa sp.]
MMSLPASSPGVATRVLVTDDYPVIREGIKALLAGQDDVCVVAEAADGAEGVAMYEAHRPDVTLMDLRMPRMGGIDATRAIRAAHPQARVVVLTSYDGDADIHRALRAGACGYLIKDTLAGAVLDGVRAAAAGRRVIPPGVARRLAEFTPRVDLTEREVEVLRLVAKGLRNREVARVIGRTDGTVKVHLAHILAKLGAEDRTEAVTIALQRGVIHLDD